MRLKYVIARAPGPVAIPSFFRPVPMVHTASSTGSPRRCDHRLAMTCSFSGGISTPNCTRSTGICQRATGCIDEDIGEIRHYRPVGAIHESPADANGIEKSLPPPQGEVAERSEVGGGVLPWLGHSPSQLTLTAPSERGPGTYIFIFPHKIKKPCFRTTATGLSAATRRQK